jgi:hypothetical protein
MNIMKRQHCTVLAVSLLHLSSQRLLSAPGQQLWLTGHQTARACPVQKRSKHATVRSQTLKHSLAHFQAHAAAPGSSGGMSKGFASLLDCFAPPLLLRDASAASDEASRQGSSLMGYCAKGGPSCASGSGSEAFCSGSAAARQSSLSAVGRLGQGVKLKSSDAARQSSPAARLARALASRAALAALRSSGDMGAPSQLQRPAVLALLLLAPLLLAPDMASASRGRSVIAGLLSRCCMIVSSLHA